MKTYDEKRMILLKAANWIGALGGSGLGIFFTYIRYNYPDANPVFTGITRYLYPVFLAITGAILGWFLMRWMAALIITGKSNPLFRVFKGTLLGMLSGGLMLIFLGEIYYLGNQAWGDFSFKGGIPAILTSVFVHMGIIGGIFGAVAGFLFGLVTALTLIPEPDEDNPSIEKSQINIDF